MPMPDYKKNSVMERLPIEVVANIAHYLPVKDVASCCAVSPWWRDVFGSDEVWRPRCDVESEEYLRKSPCRVEPKFTNPQPDNSTLSPIGRWRTAYMREAHLRENWVWGNCVEEKIKTDSNSSVMFFNNNIVMMTCRDSIKLIDTRVNPSVVVSELRSPGVGDYQVQLVRSDMFITFSDSGNIVKIVEVDLASHTLSVKHTLCVSESERIISYIVIGNTFLGLDTKYVHIWNLDSGKKLKTESCSLVNGHFKHFSDNRQKKNCEDVVVIAQEQNGDYHCYIYNVQELMFLPFTKYFQMSSLRKNFGTSIMKHYVALAFDGSVRIYNYKTSQLLHEVAVSVRFPLVGVLRESFIFINSNQDLVVIIPSTGAKRCLHKGAYGFRWIPGVKLINVYIRTGGYKLFIVEPESIVRCLVDPSGLINVNKSLSKMLPDHNNFSSTQKICLHFW